VGTYAVTAVAQGAGYQLSGYPAGGWNLTIEQQACIEFIAMAVGGQGATSVALPAGWQPGDLAVVMLARNACGFGTPPVVCPPPVPTGFTSWGTASAGTGSSSFGSRLAYRVLQAGDTTVAITGTGWRSALVLVYRHATAGVAVPGSGTSATTTFPGLALQQTNGSSWVGAMAGTFNGLGAAAAPTGMVKRNTTGGIGGFDTNGGVASFASRSIPSSGAWNSFSFELKAQ
jgi:hypothetical protein